MKHIYKVCGKISILCYIFIMYELWHLCKYGGIRNHLPSLAFWTVICAAMFILWLIAKRKLNNKIPNNSQKSKIYYTELLIFAVSTVFFCGQIVYSAIPYNGALSWKIDDLIHKKEVALEHNNIFEDGIEGIINDIDKKLNLPEELYISESFQVRFDANGTVKNINTLLYGKHNNGKFKTYLVDYNANKSDHMTIWLDAYTDGNYNEDMKLFPMFRILENADWQKKVAYWSKSNIDHQYEIFYAGRRTFDVYDGLKYLPGDADGDGIDNGTNCLSCLLSGGNVAGFEVSLHIPESESITPVRYIMEPSYITPEKISEEHTEQQIEQSKNEPSWTIDQNNGNMYFFLDDSNGWRLTVTDAAAGSRFYIVEKTKDSGVSWGVVNKNPFEGQTGVAEGLIFHDDSLGFIGLSGASQTTSSLYITKDGGITFQKIKLPMEQVTKLPETAEEYGFTIEDYDYFNMPEISGDTIKISVTTQAYEKDGIQFYSTDYGETWTYKGISK